MTCLLWKAGHSFLLLNAASDTSHPTTPKPTLSEPRGTGLAREAGGLNEDRPLFLFVAVG